MDAGKHKDSGNNSNRSMETDLDQKRSRVPSVISPRDPNRRNSPDWKLSRPDWAVFGSEVTTVAPDGILIQGQWLPTLKRPPEVAVVVVWLQTYRVDPYSPANITENRVRLENRPDWAVFGSDVTTVSPDEILMQGQWLLTPKRPSKVVGVVVWFQIYWVDLYNPAKITENRVRLENRPDWAVFGSDVTTMSPDGILRQGQWFLTPN
ncbi:hypothetical protein CDL15_Pgr021083 [Punica granatum]|uniref:Uncharacterized protein n=1 Tax=Punica granatum TaxID=22663 RepID=A0A218WR78_PUNGR|nr:hypothetical protein CDL15_Pgr021083 [Punica granatum]